MNSLHLQILFKEINLISKEYNTVKKKDSFNIFKVIRKGHEEVSLHSKFLFELLSPEGSHHKKDLFLKLFINQLGFNFNLKNVTVGLEVENIDLLIKNKSQAIIIENKIYAGDQPEQLSRYYEIIKDKRINDIYIVYLSLNGKPPSTQSIEGIPKDFIKDRLFNKSYNQFINTWLSKCVKESATAPALRETIIQYQHLLKQLTMSNEVEERIKLLSLLGQENNMEQASYLVNNWVHMRWHTEMDFWNTLFNNMPDHLKSYKPIDEYLFTSNNIDNTVHSSRNRSFDYGIALHLFGYTENENICFFIERGQQNVEYGIIVDHTKKKDDFTIKGSSFKDYLVEKFPDDYTGNDDSPWIHWKFPQRNINFEKFNTADTLALANPDKRLVIVNELWAEISEYIATVMQWNEIPSIQ